MKVLKSTHSLKIVQNNVGDFEVWVDGERDVICTHYTDALAKYNKLYSVKYCIPF